MQALAVYWADLPEGGRRDPVLVETYVDCLLARGEEAAAEGLLHATLERGWSPVLVERYGRLAGAGPGRRLEVAEAWLAQRPRDPALLLALGRLCLHNRLWGKARAYLEAAIGAGGSPYRDACRELGALLERLGEREEALACYRRGLGVEAGMPIGPEGEGGQDPSAGPKVRWS